MSWEWLLAVAPVLLLLACPLIMWSMMKGMSGGGACHGESGARSEAGEAGLQREVEVLRARVADLEGASPAPTAGAGAGAGDRAADS